MDHGGPAGCDLCHHAGKVAGRVAVERVGRAADLEPEGVGGVDRGVVDGRVDAQVVALPAQLEGALVASAKECEGSFFHSGEVVAESSSATSAWKTLAVRIRGSSVPSTAP